MFENHFGFIRRPFTAAPDAELFVANEATQTAKEAIEYCLRSGQGIAVLTAPVGIGKTMLCQVLMSSLAPDFRISFLPSPGTSSCLGLLQAIYFGLGQRVKKKHAGITDAEMRLELIETVRELRRQTSGIAVIVDEAHLLSTQQLEEIRVLSSYHDRGQPLIRPLLCGTPEFEERLLDPTLKALNQRIRCQTYLSRLTRAESEQFIQEQLARAGVRNRRVFDIEAIATIVAASDGSPRCLNQLCDQSLYLAARSGESTVSSSVVGEALDELVQLPLEYNRPLQAMTKPADSPICDEVVVEFGSLDDDPLGPDESTSSVDTNIEIGALADEEPVAESVPSQSCVEFGSLDGPGDSAFDASAVLGTEKPADADSDPASPVDTSLVEHADDTYELQRSHEIDEELEASFRRGLPDAPVLDSAANLTEDSPEAKPAWSGSPEPRFDSAKVSEDLIAAGLNPLDIQHATDDPATVEDAWADNTPVLGVRSVDVDYIALEETDAENIHPVSEADEEELIESCVHTRKQIASMLDSLESHVSESLSQQYDVVMPEETGSDVFRIASLEADVRREAVGSAATSEDVVPSEEGRLGDRLSRVIRHEQGLL